jgi:hypothetical protein
MRCLCFRWVEPGRDDFSLDFPDDYDVHDIIEILGEREALDKAVMRLEHNGKVLDHTELVSSIDSSLSNPISLYARPESSLSTPGIPPPANAMSAALDELQSMGYSRDLAQKALTLGGRLDVAVELLLANNVSEMGLQQIGVAAACSLGREGSYAILKKALRDPESLALLQSGRTISLSLPLAGGLATVPIRPEQADACLRYFLGIGLRDYRIDMEIPDRDPGANSVTTEELLQKMWAETFLKLSLADQGNVRALASEGIELLMALKLYIAADKNIDCARSLWISCQ